MLDPDKLNDCEVECNEHYYADESLCRAVFDSDVAAGLPLGQCEERLTACLLRAEVHLDRCIADCAAKYM